MKTIDTNQMNNNLDFDNLGTYTNIPPPKLRSVMPHLGFSASVYAVQSYPEDSRKNCHNSGCYVLRELAARRRATTMPFHEQVSTDNSPTTTVLTVTSVNTSTSTILKLQLRHLIQCTKLLIRLNTESCSCKILLTFPTTHRIRLVKRVLHKTILVETGRRRNKCLPICLLVNTALGNPIALK